MRERTEPREQARVGEKEAKTDKWREEEEGEERIIARREAAFRRRAR